MSVKASISIMRSTLTLFASVALVLSLVPAAALAAPVGDTQPQLVAQDGELPVSGESGTCTWEIDVDGNLVVYPTDGVSGELESKNPWWDYRDKVVTVFFDQGVKAPSYAAGMFRFHSSLVSVDLSGLDTSNVRDMSSMFEGCSSLTSLDLSPLDTSNVTWMGWMFCDCSSLTSVDFSGLDLSNMKNCSSDLGGSMYMMFVGAPVTAVYLSHAKLVGDFDMFFGGGRFEFVDLSNADLSGVTSMRRAFADCSSLKSVDLSAVNLSGQTDLSGLFSNNVSLESVKFSYADLSGVTNMSSMFYGCSSLASLDLSGLDASNATDMSFMFSGCSSLASLDLSSLDTSNVTSMYGMFAGCSSLKALDLSFFDTSRVASMSCMFNGCGSLESLDISNFDTSIANENSTSSFFPADSDSSLSWIKVGDCFELKSFSGWPSGEWRSSSTGLMYSNLQIVYERARTADTYVKVGSSGRPPSEYGDADASSAQAMFRLYNPNSGEHFYTASTIERDAVIAAGWNDEGVGWTAPTSGIRVYRLYNSYAGEHHYTTSEAERDMLVSVGWTWEEGGWFSDPDKAVPLYRAYNPNAYANNHHYTTDWGEFQTLLSLGWQDEGVAWHGVG